jgi:hypothetical protein
VVVAESVAAGALGVIALPARAVLKAIAMPPVDVVPVAVLVTDVSDVADVDAVLALAVSARTVPPAAVAASPRAPASTRTLVPRSVGAGRTGGGPGMPRASEPTGTLCA